MTDHQRMIYCRHDSPIGPLTLAGREGVLCALRFPKGASPATVPDEWNEDKEAFAAARAELDAYFAHRLQVFTVPYALEGSAFQRRVWQALAAIPYGALRSYGDIAKAVGQPGGARAVGLANNANPLPLIVPCHRVIGADGSLVGFGGGLALKIRLLEHEGISPSQVHSPDQMQLDL